MNNSINPQLTINWSQVQQEALEIKEEKKQQELEFQENLEAASEEVNERVYGDDGHFSYGDIEDIMHGYGLEMDYIEDILF